MDLSPRARAILATNLTLEYDLYRFLDQRISRQFKEATKKA